MTESYKHLVEKLNAYIRRYYQYQILRGLIYFILLVISYFTLISIVEYFAYLSTTVRTILFFFSLLMVLGIGVFYVFTPFLKLVGLLKGLDYEKAASIISEHFPEIEDRLLNIIELSKIEEEDSQSLIWASIDEKINKLRLFDFSKAVSFQHLLVKGLYIMAALLVAVVLYFSMPGLFTQTSYRLISFNRQFVKPAPFTFHLLNDSLQVKKGDQLTLSVRCEGSDIPDFLYVNIAGSNYMMKNNKSTFSYQLEHVNNSFSVYFTNLAYQSKKFKIDVLPAPIITNYQVEIKPPAYTGFDRKKENMTGDLEVPFGSKITWVFHTVDADSLIFNFGKQRIAAKMENGAFHMKYEAKSSVNYAISVKNKNFNYKDLLSFDLEVTPDLYPEIKVVQLRDSTDFTRYYFKGTIGDDYGFHDLKYHLVIHQKDSTIDVPILKNLNQEDFYFTYDFKDIAGLANRVDYYFSVRDNDYFHGYKETSSETFQFVFPSKDELDKMENKQYQNLEALMQKSSQLSQDIQNSIEQLKYKSLSENASDWEKQQMVSDILNKKNELQDVLKQIQQSNADMNNMQNSFSDQKKEMVEKQKQIEKLLDDVFNDELKKLFEEFNKLAQNFDQSKFDELSKRSEMSMDDLSKQLERNLQMLKRMKVQQDVEKVIDSLKELAQKERDNASELDQSKDFQKTSSQENENQNQLKSASEDLKKALEMNESLDKPMNLQPMDQEFNEINSNYNEISDHLQKKRKNKSVEGMQKNADSFDNAAFALNQMLASNMQQQNMENLRDLQQILDNLIYLSLKQESLHHTVSVVDNNDPKLALVRIEQEKLIRQSQVVKDSLYALAKRTPQIGNVITKELMSLELNMSKAKDDLEDNRLSTALKEQQMAMTAANNMALFLNEALQNLQKQMANAMPGDQQCDKPGGKGKGNNMSLLKESQQSLKQQLQQMIEQMKQGKTGNMSEQIGKTLAQQEMMQQMIRDMMMNSEVGSSAKEQLKQIQQLLDENHHDLINKNITSELINRQNSILNKLLKAEKAEMERDMDNERESKTALDKFYSNPIQYFEYKSVKKDYIDLIQRNNYQLKNFYERKYKDYINNLRDNN